jgi:hypothetical protein
MTTRTDRPDLVTRLMLRWSLSRQVDGLWIGSFDDKEAAEADLDRVEAALNLIKTYDPQRYRRLLRDLDRVWVLPIAEGLASFNCSIWACNLDPRHVRDEAKSPERIAASIVHEATHARLRRCGIGYPQELRTRVEAVCFRRERAFAARLPNGEPIREQADQSPAAYAGQDYWTDEAFRIRDEVEVVTMLQYRGVPSPLARAVGAIRSLRLRLRRARG